jgi:hypothetical protein
VRGAKPRTATLRTEAAVLVPAAAVLLALAGCAARVPRRPATAAEAAGILARWDSFRDAVLARPAAELFYEARARRSLASESGIAAIRDDPGRTLTVVLEEGGLPVARASWDGTRTVVRRTGRSEEREIEGDAPLTPIGIPLSARSLSLLLFGLPDASPPESVAIAGESPWLSWNGGALSCELDSAGRPRRVVSAASGRTVEIRFAEWSEGIPSRIRLEASGGGSAELRLRPGAGS